MNTGSSSIWRGRRVPGWECHLVSLTAEVASLSCGLLKVWWWWCARVGSVGTHYCLAVGNDEGLELDETDEDEELCESDEEEVEEYEGEDVGGIQCGGGRQENSLRDYSLNSRGLIYKYRVVCA